jgi:dipeptidyl aminopeptidase/acylaminoacyl peptidase
MVRGFLLIAGAASAALALATSAQASSGAAACQGRSSDMETTATRLISARDLVELRDIGPSANADVTAPILTVSPDKQSVAFQVRQANIDTNSYCLSMFVLDLERSSAPRLVDQGGDFFFSTFSQLGFAALTPPGYMPTITPTWSPDSRWIAYLRRDKGITQVWRARRDGTVAEAVTHLTYDAEQVVWSADGTSLIVSGRPELVKARAVIKAEGQGGYLVDDRALPAAGVTPQPREPIASVFITIDMLTGSVRPATTAEITRLIPSDPPEKPKAAVGYFAGPSDAAAWTTAFDPDAIISPKRLHVRWAGGKVTDCPDNTCDPIAKLWWSGDGRTLWLQRAGYGVEGTDLFRWDAGDPSPHRLSSTFDVLIGCDRAQTDLICGFETATAPRRLVRIDLKTGDMRTIYDPNPEFALLRLGPVTRLHTKNAFGIASWGDLVLPPDHQPGQTHPLVVVQYESRGFLRGGTGDDYPIQLMAAKGLAVLSLQRPAHVAMTGRATSWDDFNRIGQKDWADRRSILSAVDLGIDAAIATGTIDPHHLGITGMSDGGTTVQFALVNDPRFAAAAVSSCCYEPSAITSLAGPAIAKWFGDIGYPRLTDDADEIWRPMSIVKNAGRINTPLLMQLNEHEYLGALEAHTALVEKHQPVELFVYPDEYHVKWQPQHRLATYVRAVDWFRFWLQGREDPDLGKAGQYERWRKLKP